MKRFLLALAVLVFVAGVVFVFGRFVSRPFEDAANKPAVDTCMEYLAIVDSAKKEYMTKAGSKFGLQYGTLFNVELVDAVTMEELVPYLRGMKDALKCPTGGKYRIGYLGETPVCSVHGAHGMDAVCAAAVGGDVGKLQAIKAGGGVIDWGRYYNGWSPLHYAAFGGQAAALKFMLGDGSAMFSGLDVNSMTMTGHTAADLAATEAAGDMLKMNGGWKVYGALKERYADVLEMRERLKLALKARSTGSQSFSFICGLANASDTVMLVKILRSEVLDIHRGTAFSRGTTFSKPGRRLCEDGALITLQPGATHRFGWQMDYEIFFRLTGLTITEWGVRYQILGVDPESGAAGGRETVGYDRLVETESVAAWIFARVESEGIDSIEMPLMCVPLRYLAAAPPGTRSVPDRTLEEWLSGGEVEN